MDDPELWLRAARCRGRMDLFFAPHAERPPARDRREAEARRLCAGCPVRVPCRTHARRVGETGIWGGESEEERVAAGFEVRIRSVDPISRRTSTA